ncbi:unnamed protein product [Mytilus coruscus]|uniref:Uncharacterized protein n=1 Tax=Mytilus coruscus TaxID=42192 RepID=A0A6J8DLF9_MYTCO|nr:unnamed protein product [Mytilus coruscus]
MDIKVDIDIDTDSLDLMDDDMPPCGQTARSDLKIVQDTISEVRKLNDTRFPLLTLIHRMKFDRENDNFSCLNISFRPNYGNKENCEALKEPMDKCLIEAKEQAYQSVLSILDTRVQELNSTISTVLNTGISFFDINSPLSGEARTKLAKEANNINEEYTLKLRKFVTDMRHKSRSNKDSPRGPTRERDERRTPYSKNERRDKTPKNRSKKQKDNDSKNNDLLKIFKDFIKRR